MLSLSVTCSLSTPPPPDFPPEAGELSGYSTLSGRRCVLTISINNILRTVETTRRVVSYLETPHRGVSTKKTRIYPKNLNYKYNISICINQGKKDGITAIIRGKRQKARGRK